MDVLSSGCSSSAACVRRVSVDITQRADPPRRQLNGGLPS